MTGEELKAVFEVVCRDCKGRDRCLVPVCQGLADELTTAIDEAVAERVAKAEECGPELLTKLKRVIGWATERAPTGEAMNPALMEEANAAIAKAEGRE